MSSAVSRGLYSTPRCSKCEHKHKGHCGPVVTRISPELSYRENQVVALLCQGYSNPAIAVELGVSEETIKRHLVTIFDKCGMGSRLEAAIHYLHYDLKIQVDALEAQLERERKINARLKRQLEREVAISNALAKSK